MIRDNNYASVKKLKLAFNSITIYRKILNEPVIGNLYRLIEYLYSGNVDVSTAIDLYNRLVYSFFDIEPGPCTSLAEYLADRIIHDENPYSRLCESTDFLSMPANLKAAVSNDLHYLQLISEASPEAIKSTLLSFCQDNDFEKIVVNNLQTWNDKASRSAGCGVSSSQSSLLQLFSTCNSWSELLESLYNFYNQNGCGVFARYNAFIWEYSAGKGYLNGICNPDPVRLSDLIGYEGERAEVISNTQQFLKGFRANNMLLYGDRGTGKSSTVKAILNEFSNQGLRLIEVPKMHLADFHEIIRLLKGRKQKFIVFVDDLVFEDNEENYTTLKAVLEGGIEAKPDNVIIYATSNRRHLIKEKFSDRLGLQSPNHDDEVRAADTLQEKLSLSDRFGITVVFSSPDKQKYLQIVEGIAQKRGLKYERDYLEREALKWELWYNGRSPRTARQFVDWLEGQG